MLHAPKTPLIIWRLTDGKPGHESQSLGLVQALARLRELRCEDIPVAGLGLGPLDWIAGRFPPGFVKPRPDLIIGAGHRTHWPLLCARRVYGGQTLALMKPSLPKHWFRWVVAPEHDGVSGGNVIVTRGVLNAVRPGRKRSGRALLLLGGVSKHFIWDDARVMAQVDALLAAFPQALITDSRRTPDSLRQLLAKRYAGFYQPWDRCPPGWLAAELAVAESVWVSEDSVSMIYEALSADCAVGLIGLQRPQQEPGRLVRGIASLVEAGLVARFDDWHDGRPLHPPQPPLREADRVAELVMAALAESAA